MAHLRPAKIASFRRNDSMYPVFSRFRFPLLTNLHLVLAPHSSLRLYHSFLCLTLASFPLLSLNHPISLPLKILLRSCHSADCISDKNALRSSRQHFPLTQVLSCSGNATSRSESKVEHSISFAAISVKRAMGHH
ncbi:unnamed protein product [Protopolystoma xenopodis]|uniref:Uncharacterized protein n=1 Tax=Protopolystoma xenopodis TaxID=117903 RepID=A0A3S5CIM2_9PLAT|nr:unnamed protein product [Protopolystoma xenopodis]